MTTNTPDTNKIVGEDPDYSEDSNTTEVKDGETEPKDRTPAESRLLPPTATFQKVVWGG